MAENNSKIAPEFLMIVGIAFAKGDGGLTGPVIGRVFSEYAVRFGVTLPFPEGPGTTVTKLDAFLGNIKSFSPEQQYVIIYELSFHPSVIRRDEEKARELRLTLISKYHQHSGLLEKPDINLPLIEETRHWLHKFPNVSALYNSAFEKHGHQVFERNLLDDLRLALEKLLNILLNNTKSLENQMSALGNFISEHRGSKEICNMFTRLVDYYTKYQNTYVKHNDSVNRKEIDFVLELTSSFMKYLIRLEQDSD